MPPEVKVATMALYATFTQIRGFGVLCPVSELQVGQFVKALLMYFRKHTCIVPHELDPSHSGRPMV